MMTSPFDTTLTTEPDAGLVEHFSCQAIAPRSFALAIAQRDALACELANLKTWRPIESAPRDFPILAWCDHEADPYSLDEGKSLTLYAAHAEGLSHAPTGIHIIEWGGGFDDRTYEQPVAANLPDWWFVVGSEFEVAANPLLWLPLPKAPS